jgi:hypothetical protein
MLLNTIKKTVGPHVGRALLAGKNYSPELYLAGGIVMGIGSAIMLAKAHKQSDEVLSPTIEEIEHAKGWIVEENIKAVEETGHEKVDRSEAQSIVKPLYGTLVLDTIKLYGPGVIMGLGSIALIMASHGVLRNRNRALISSVALLERGFSTYRKRVVDEFGKDADERLYFGAESRDVVTIEETKDGKTRKRKSKRNHIPENPTPLLYGRVFDETIPRWSPDRSRNETWLRMMQSMMNDKLDQYHVVFLNDVYAQLGFRKTAVGAVAGWCKDLPGGDGYISFGLDNAINLNKGDNRWILDFNVQGNILDGVGNEEAPELY